MKILKINAFAKLNLGLQVLNKRTDGFHDINTVFIRTSLYDEIEISTASELEFECYPKLDIPNEENLVFKAAVFFKEKYNLEKLNVRLKLTKHIPTGGGLGGGSSDAASSLTGLRKFLEVPYNYRDLFDTALGLGSDVPYFLKNGTAVAKGKGEQLSYFRYSLSYYVLLVFPGININTGWAYGQLKNTDKPEKPVDFQKILIHSQSDKSILKKELFNDFERPVFEKYPEIGRIKDKLYSYGAVYAQMSGSGSTIFGLFENIKEAEIAAATFKNYKTFISAPKL